MKKERLIAQVRVSQRKYEHKKIKGEETVESLFEWASKYKNYSAQNQISIFKL